MGRVEARATRGSQGKDVDVGLTVRQEVGVEVAAVLLLRLDCHDVLAEGLGEARVEADVCSDVHEDV